ncbi:MAG TPA: hypothetical protein ENI15_01585 [Spirochaetes bacterium]|nr:hypothetical protein [Spirochaetota bacterium]
MKISLPKKQRNNSYDTNYPALPRYFTAGTAYFNDWGLRGSLSGNKDAFQMNITIYELYRYYSKWYDWYANYAPYFTNINREQTRGGWYTSVTWPWFSVPYLSNYYYNNFLNIFPGNNLGATGGDITCTYSLDGDSLTLTFDPGGLNQTYVFQRN